MNNEFKIGDYVVSGLTHDTPDILFVYRGQIFHTKNVNGFKLYYVKIDKIEWHCLKKNQYLKYWKDLKSELEKDVDYIKWNLTDDSQIIVELSVQTYMKLDDHTVNKDRDYYIQTVRNI